MVPKGEKRLGKIGLDRLSKARLENGLEDPYLNTPTLVVNVMVSSIIREEPLKGVERQRVSAVIIDGFQCAAGIEQHSLSSAHSCDFKGQTSAQSIK